MPYCSQCGVEVHLKTEKCPLCEAPIQKLFEDPHPERNYPEEAAPTSPLPPLSMREKLRIARGISVIVFLIPILFSTTIDFFINKGITWSAYVITSLIGVLLITLTALFLPRRNGLVNLLTHIITLIVCCMLNVLTGLQYPWALHLALPILFSSWIITQSILKVAKQRKGHLLASAILLGLGLLCLVIDFVINLMAGHSSLLGWSLIVISALIPTSLLLLYLYSTQFRKSKFRRFIHL